MTATGSPPFTHPELLDGRGRERVYATHKGMLKALRKKRGRDARKERRRLQAKVTRGAVPGPGDAQDGRVDDDRDQ